MPYMDQDTIRLLDEIEEGEVIEIVYSLGEDRQRMAIGEFDGYRKVIGGDWAVFRKNAFVGIKTIDIVSITRVPQAETA